MRFKITIERVLLLVVIALQIIFKIYTKKEKTHNNKYEIEYRKNQLKTIESITDEVINSPIPSDEQSDSIIARFERKTGLNHLRDSIQSH